MVYNFIAIRFPSIAIPLKSIQRGTLLACIMVSVLVNSNYPLYSQDTCNPDKAAPSKQLTALTVIDFFTTFTGVRYLNGYTTSEKNNLNFYYNFTVNNKIKAGKLSVSNYYYTDLGIRDYQDSITIISDDQFTIKNAIAYQFLKSKFSFSLGINSKSQYFRHYEYGTDTAGNITRTLFTAYQSPGYRNFSCGIRYDISEKVSIEFGLVNGKTTLMKNQEIFDSRNSNKLYGLEKGTKKKSESGFNLVLTIPPNEISKSLFFENFSQFNVNRADIDRIKYYKFDINNAIHYIFLKHFRLTLRTLCRYDLNTGKMATVIHHLSAGFYLNNTF